MSDEKGGGGGGGYRNAGEMRLAHVAQLYIGYMKVSLIGNTPDRFGSGPLAGRIRNEEFSSPPKRIVRE